MRDLTPLIISLKWALVPLLEGICDFKSVQNSREG